MTNPNKDISQNNPSPKEGSPLELHVCMGLNSCKNQGFSQNNECAGQGDCATVVHPCHTVNDCKNQGGCGLFGTDEELCVPGVNDCKYAGSCGSPILASRFIAQGPNKGRSVWQLARELFEKRREQDGKPYLPPPKGQEYGPTQEYVAYRKIGEACAQSGSRYCSFAFNEKKKDRQKTRRREKFMKESQQKIQSTMDNCNCE